MKYAQCFIIWGLAVVLFLSIVAMGCCSTRNNVNLTPKANVDLLRYLGQWSLILA